VTALLTTPLIYSLNWSKLTVIVILSLIAGCGSKDPLEGEQSSLALKTDTLVLSPIGPYWPAKIEGDCEFNGHGPFVRVKARLYVTTDSLMCHVYMYARETEDNWSTAEGSRETLLYRANAGWTIDDLLVDPDSCEATYIDDTHCIVQFDTLLVRLRKY
jgi:hypothetical protein